MPDCSSTEAPNSFYVHQEIKDAYIIACRGLRRVSSSYALAASPRISRSSGLPMLPLHTTTPNIPELGEQMASARKDRTPRLRLSCDECYRAKVRCSKHKEMCVRCMTNGLSCKYSPSNRAGKQKGDTHATQARSSDNHNMSSPNPANNSSFHAGPSHNGASHVLSYDPVWHTGVQVPVNSSSSADFGIGAFEPALSQGVLDLRAWYLDMNNFDSNAPGIIHGGFEHSQHSRNPPLDLDMAVHTLGNWQGDQNLQQQFNFRSIPLQTVSSQMQPTLPSTTMPYLAPTTQQSAAVLPVGYGMPLTCDCFRIMVQCLQDLQNAPATLFDSALILKLNGKALEACLFVLGCSQCMGKREIDTAMTLATIIGKVTRLYNSVYQNLHQDNGSAIRGFELKFDQLFQHGHRKLQQVRDQFKAVYAELTENPEVRLASMSYIIGEPVTGPQSFQMENYGFKMEPSQ